MPDDAAPSASPSARPAASAPTSGPPGVWYSYAIVRLVPRVERGERINVGVVLFSRERRHLSARIALDRPRVQAFAPDLDLALVERHLATFLAICDGRSEGGPLSDLPPAERFHWLVAPRSTVIQTSPAHAGQTTDLAAELDRLLAAYVHPPAAAL
jgi:hypothetical protein